MLSMPHNSQNFVLFDVTIKSTPSSNCYAIPLAAIDVFYP